jgi:GrpB-like predicted nucleotidyltransferase (UPF0157 family)
MDFLPEESFRAAVAEAFEEHRRAIVDLLPSAAVEHIGATAVPGALTKGDLDLLVSVPGEEFAAAVEALQGRYAIHQPENWGPTFASFKQEPAGDVPVGVQLVVAGSADERSFLDWRDRLRGDPELRAEYDAMKRAEAGSDPDAYWAVKNDFIRLHC